MRARLCFATATFASLTLIVTASHAQPATPPSDAPEAEPETPAAAPEGQQETSPADALPPPSDEGTPEADEGTPYGEQPEAPPHSAQPSPQPPPPHGPPTAVPWYPDASAPAAQYQPPLAQPQDDGPTRDMSKDFWQVYAGVRTSWIPNDGYNPFDDNDVFSQASVGASRALVLSPSFSFAPGVLWEGGAVKDRARGAQSELIVHRLGAVAEGRVHLGRDVYVLGKVIPQAVHTRAYLSEESSPAQLQQKTWRLGMDATAGAAWNVPRTLGAKNAVPQFWLVGELGYGWTMSKDLELSPDVDEDDPQARMKLDLGPMALRGLMMRVNVAVTF